MAEIRRLRGTAFDPAAMDASLAIEATDPTAEEIPPEGASPIGVAAASAIGGDAGGRLSSSS